MSNDTSTLNGALSQLGETIATNLENLNIEADASDGLTTLANKINQVPSVMNYSYELTSNNYNPIFNNNIILTCKVTDSVGNPIENENLTLFKNGNQTSYISNTDSSGVAIFDNVLCDEWGLIDYSVKTGHCEINVIEKETFSIEYTDGSKDTIIFLNKSLIQYYDDCSTNKISNYLIMENYNTPQTFKYDEVNECYNVIGDDSGSNDEKMFLFDIGNFSFNEIGYKISMKVKCNNSREFNKVGCGFYNHNKMLVVCIGNEGSLCEDLITNHEYGFDGTKYSDVNNWYDLIFTYENGIVSVEIWDGNDLYYTYSVTITMSSPLKPVIYVGHSDFSANVSFKNIEIEVW